MRLRALLAEAGMVGVTPLVPAGSVADPEVGSIGLDSRRVVPGMLFACVPGATADGHDHAAAAVASGAAGLVVDRPLDVAVAQVVVPSVRPALAQLAAALAGHPSRRLRMVGVTGTNGKTTTVALLAGIFEANGWATGTIGTLTQLRTTPEAPELHSRLARLRDTGTEVVAMEVSSHALAQHRVDAIHFAVAVLTNVTQDHLDYHRTMEAYFEAKASLFTPGRAGTAVVNADDEWGGRLLGRLAGSAVATVPYRASDVEDLRLSAAGSRFRLDGHEVVLHIPGRFNVANAVGAAATARSLGVPAATVAAGLSAVKGVPGRFQTVDLGQRFTVVVDYAHTPDGLATALRTARELATGRLLVVFGAGGDRDRDKRPVMGAAAALEADLAIVTSDNPRHEEPRTIIDQVVAGVAADRRERVTVQADRRAAIGMAVALAEVGDVVVVAGKGHETGQDFGDHVEPFDDVIEVTEALRRILRSRRPVEGGGVGQ